ncbi:MAG: large conductance mechanosensitive channel protein MscL [Actinobacteria bacterium]|nr:large conductance mechanosensitive channel protein MscL [Actinomycetota bacterium]
MFKGFKEFILRGNVIDLAVAVVIGGAFAAVVSAFVSKIITPIINAAPGAKSQGLGFSLRHGTNFVDKSGNNTTFVDLSGIINAIIVFVITAAVVYIIFVLPMNKLAERRLRGKEPEPEKKAEDVLLLEEIRDLLRAKNSAS